MLHKIFTTFCESFLGTLFLIWVLSAATLLTFIGIFVALAD